MPASSNTKCGKGGGAGSGSSGSTVSKTKERIVDSFRDFAMDWLKKNYRYIGSGPIPISLQNPPGDILNDSLTATFWIQGEFKRLGLQDSTFENCRNAFFKANAPKSKYFTETITPNPNDHTENYSVGYEKVLITKPDFEKAYTKLKDIAEDIKENHTQSEAVKEFLQYPSFVLTSSSKFKVGNGRIYIPYSSIGDGSAESKILAKIESWWKRKAKS
jgi:hypothetical protein